MVVRLFCFANFVEPLDQIRLDVDAHVLGALDQKLLVDQVPQQVLLLVLVLAADLRLRGNSGNPARTILPQRLVSLLIIGRA